MTPRLANATAFLGAFLLFLLQPVVAKHLLPQFGGAGRSASVHKHNANRFLERRKEQHLSFAPLVGL